MIRLRVRETAEKQGLNMSQLARRADLDLKTVRRIWYNPLAEVSTGTLNALAKALHCSPSELIEEVPDE